MPIAINYDRARDLLNQCLTEAETINEGDQIGLPGEVIAAIKILFQSKTQSYREVALGCSIVRFLDREADLSLPYSNLGANAYNGRSLDEQVINPFLHGNEIPSSKGPYLATFRRSVTLDATIRNGQKDKDAYDAFLILLDFLSVKDQNQIIRKVIVYILYHFVLLREKSKIQLSHIRKLRLDQYSLLVSQFTQVSSGGLIPVLISLALLQTLNECYSQNWVIENQGINEADSTSDAGGDITVKKDGNVLLVIEVTERPIDGNRVTSTFNTKILKGNVADYLFIYKDRKPAATAFRAADQYFGVGHEINFVNIHDWVINNLVTIGSTCREQFIKKLIDLLDSTDVSASIKVRWNEIIRGISES